MERKEIEQRNADDYHRKQRRCCGGWEWKGWKGQSGHYNVGNMDLAALEV